MKQPEFLRGSSFRLAATFACTFAASTVVLFGFIYWQTARFEKNRIDAYIASDAKAIAASSHKDVLQAVELRILGDIPRVSFAALFDPNGHRLVGNLDSVPSGLPIDGKAHRVKAVRSGHVFEELQAIRAVARRLPGGDLLVIGRDIDELEELWNLIGRALELGVIPAVVLSLLAGAFVSYRAQERVKAVHRAAERIMAGALGERLPVHGSSDDFDRLAASVNLMLDEISRLLDSVKAAGDGIAHDLRTPLARLQTRLEQGTRSARRKEALEDTIDKVIVDLDQVQQLIRTLLRISEMESGSRRVAFRSVDLGLLAEEVVQIYEPVAEEKQISLSVDSAAGLMVNADGGLLVEAVANLVQNAIKFTPAGGTVRLSAASGPEGPTIEVHDTGPGIPADEQEKVFDRFYRADKDRHEEGAGLGLSLVASIARLHGFAITLESAGAGCVFKLVCAAPGDGRQGQNPVRPPDPETHRPAGLSGRA
jgi:signal transduction histidine kinase